MNNEYDVISSGAENYLWPDQSLDSQYPDIKGKKYLCSGMMMGYASTFWAILNYKVCYQREL